MMPILVKSDDVRSGRKAKGRHSPLWRLGSQWVNGGVDMLVIDSVRSQPKFKLGAKIKKETVFAL